MSEIPKDAREVYCNEAGEPIAFCPVESLGITDIQRAQFYQINKERLGKMAMRAIEKTKLEGERFAVICIDVDDPRWHPLVDMLMPGHDWDSIRAQGQTPVARGVVPHALCVDVVQRFYPAAGEAQDGWVHSFVLAAGGIAIYQETRES